MYAQLKSVEIGKDPKEASGAPGAPEKTTQTIHSKMVRQTLRAPV